MFDFFNFFLYPLPMSKKPASSSKSAKAASPVTELPDGPAGEHGLTTRQLKILEVIQSAALRSYDQRAKLDQSLG